MNEMSTKRPTGRALRALVVAGIALSIAGGSSALAQAQGAPARSAEQNAAHACASSHPTLSRGSTGDCVYVAQKILYLIGFRGTPLDGVFGPVTEQIVREYQGSAGIEADGIVGPDTWTALIRSLEH
ncbi:peptidoglycan-binding domain-containing protein [Nocardia carnea]|uniref:peptidoglycan-binding domain-containing protein n=1 Tax=Nocardia carnea TaxID=37328 RepID=UPI0024576CF6|nr:peptidoglycan-binding domain-containing protein [Nocardia carnea]